MCDGGGDVEVRKGRDLACGLDAISGGDEDGLHERLGVGIAVLAHFVGVRYIFSGVSVGECEVVVGIEQEIGSLRGL